MKKHKYLAISIFILIAIIIGVTACGGGKKEPESIVETTIEKITEEETTIKEEIKHTILLTNMTKVSDFVSRYNEYANEFENLGMLPILEISETNKEVKLSKSIEGKFKLNQGYIEEVTVFFEVDDLEENSKNRRLASEIILALAHSMENKEDSFFEDFLNRTAIIPKGKAFNLESDDYEYNMSRLGDSVMIAIRYTGKTEEVTEDITDESSSGMSVEEAYIEMENIDEKNPQLTKTTDGYTFRNMKVKEEDVLDLFGETFFEYSTGYDCIADILTKLCTSGGNDFESYPEDFYLILTGKSTPSSWDELKEDAAFYNTFIKINVPLADIMRALNNTEHIEGVINIVDSEYDFTITSLSSMAKELKISEQMLGYVLATVQIYCADKIEFNGDTAHVYKQNLKN